MFQVDLQVYVYALSMLMIFSISTIVMVIYNLKKANVAAVSLRMYGYYFLIGLVGWVGLAIKDATQVEMDLTLPVIFYMVCSFFLWLALKECTECNLTIFSVGVMHVVVIIANVMAGSDLDRMILSNFYVLVVYPVLFFLAYSTARRNKNIGQSIIAFATFLVICALPLQFYGIYVLKELNFVYGVALAASSSGFVLVGIGFLTSVIVAEHQQLTRQALKDPLTGLLNRRGLDYSLRVALNSAQRLGKCISVVALDIDYFKKINDFYGHSGGDFVLQEFSKTLQDNARGMDVCCRLGGEEFVIVLMDTKLEKAVEIAERVRNQIENLELSFAKKTIKLTASFGVASECTDVDLGRMLKSADKALYNAKAEGRNRVCV